MSLVESRSLETLRSLHLASGAGRTKYALLIERLRTLILGGMLEAGSRLPNERDLAALTGLSLGTVQRALRTLVSDGYVVRRPKLGSFVAEHRKQLREPLHCRFLDDDGVTVLPVFPKTLKRRVVREAGPWTRHLGAAPGGTLFIERRFDVAGEFDVLSRFWGEAIKLAPLRVRPLSSLDGENFKLLIARECLLPITRVVHRLSQRPLPDGSDGATQGSASASGLLLEAFVWSHEQPLYYQQFLIPPTRRSMLFTCIEDGAMLTEGTPGRLVDSPAIAT